MDLVADPTPCVEPPVVVDVGGASLQIDSAHEILVNKLCALLGRSELRDLDDVRELLAKGGDLHRALVDAPRKDGGFSPLTLAWVLRGLPVRDLALAVGLPESDADDLAGFAESLIDRVVRLATPPPSSSSGR